MSWASSPIWPPSRGVLVLVQARVASSHSMPPGLPTVSTSTKTVARSIELLAAAGQICREHDHYRRVSIAAIQARPPGAASGTPLREYWAEVARSRFGDRDGALLAWNMGTVSEDDYTRIVEIQRRAYREVQAVVAASDRAERRVLLSWALGFLDSEQHG